MLLEPMPVAILAGSALPWRAAHCSLALARWREVEHALASFVDFLMGPFGISIGIRAGLCGRFGIYIDSTEYYVMISLGGTFGQFLGRGLLEKPSMTWWVPLR